MAAQAAGALMRYLSETQKNSLQHIAKIRVTEKGDILPLDAATRRNL